MDSEKEIFGKFKDEVGELYYCPVNEVADNTIVSEWEIENCVEASTVERYSGNIDIDGQNAPSAR